MPDVAVAVVGAIAGGLVTWLAGLLAEQKRRRRAVVAARELIRIELDDALAKIDEIEFSDLWPIGNQKRWSAAWADARRELVAGGMKPADFLVLARACARLDELERGVNTDRHPEERGLSDMDRRFLGGMRALLEGACDVLGGRQSPDPSAQRASLAT